MFNFIYDFKPYWGDIASTLCALSWAIAIVFYQKAGLKMGSASMNVFKNMVGLIFVVATLLITGEPLWPNLSGEKWITVAISAVLGVTLADVFLVAALRRLGASLQAIVDCAYSPAIMILAYFMYSEILSSGDLIGGVIVISAVWVGSQAPQTAGLVPGIGLGLLMGLTTHILNGYSILLVKPLFDELSILWIMGARFVFGQFFLVLGMIPLGKENEIRQAFQWQKGHAHAIAATFFGNYVALLLWMVGFKYTLAGRAAIYNQLSTVFIIILAAMFLDEKLNGRRLIAVVLGLIGATIVALS